MATYSKRLLKTVLNCEYRLGSVCITFRYQKLIRLRTVLEAQKL